MSLGDACCNYMDGRFLSALYRAKGGEIHAVLLRGYLGYRTFFVRLFYPDEFVPAHPSPHFNLCQRFEPSYEINCVK
jgi:hypothetical protein